MAEQEKTNFFGKLIKYVELRAQYAGLQAQEKVNLVIGRMLFGISMMFMTVSFLWFLSFALANIIGRWLDKPWLGFLIVAGGYGLIIAAVHFNRHKIMRWISAFLTDQANMLSLEQPKSKVLAPPVPKEFDIEDPKEN